MRQRECIAMLLAGGQGSRLGYLTRRVAKPALSFGGKYRVIDFSLSNCANSNIDTVGVLTQYKPYALHSYIGSGGAWDLDDKFGGGVHILPPFVGEGGGSWYKGTADAIYHNIDFINFYNPKYVLIISGDHIYKMNYELLIRQHKNTGADVTVSAIEVAWEEASRFGIITPDAADRIIRFTEKPAQPDSNLASMGVYVFTWPVLKKALLEDQENPVSANDFGKNVLPLLLEQGKKLFVYRFKDYWVDVGTVQSYYQASMELLLPEPPLNIFSPGFKIFSNEEILPPHYVGPDARISNSLICNGCTVLGEVMNSILAPGVYIGEGVCVEDSIILCNTRIGNKSRIRKAIIGENVEIKANCSLGLSTGDDHTKSLITCVEDNLTIHDGALIRAGENI
ncbi:MAG: Glucose-1-phosphate adenylyltransferase [Pelotomaculum sp. PtaB.Bin013]|uniref:Glucose-1-phosphate adenylyltransferase n=1 Tax=Pelotomaculum isophthalicicum JI TaxID=947010 RepID=A0A9X4H302_9FIRM|nr:glucose-1-phosphate adenylyltransferase [Pelotomaculum isophthalicicum]MDF9408761.1 glucose-1-phosphate adenylyltransferase [Pelotomaculum isophthalicicum JI]OPX84661.1 MAG: Glucose-1-phosphate adenylyltransferase [Pelotomaculum sp. PtaB.Bin013]